MVQNMIIYDVYLKQKETAHFSQMMGVSSLLLQPSRLHV